MRMLTSKSPLTPTANCQAKQAVAITIITRATKKIFPQPMATLAVLITIITTMVHPRTIIITRLDPSSHLCLRLRLSPKFTTYNIYWTMPHSNRANT